VIAKAIIVVWSLICIGVMINTVLHARFTDRPGVVAGIVIFHFVIWIAVIVPAALIGLLFKKSGPSA